MRLHLLHKQARENKCHFSNKNCYTTKHIYEVMKCVVCPFNQYKLKAHSLLLSNVSRQDMSRRSLLELLSRAGGGTRRLPPAVFVSGLNYKDHAQEVGMMDKIGSFPIFSMKNPSSVVLAQAAEHGALASGAEKVEEGFATIVVPAFIAKSPPEVDYEGELAVVIGETCRDVSAEDASRVIAGLTCSVDVTARRWQGQKRSGGQWSFCKGFDTFCPLGPSSLLCLDDLGSAAPYVKSMVLETRVNGVLMQSAPIASMIFDIPTMVSFLSQGTTLLAGSVILTGTPSGVGYTQKPPRFLADGDMVDVSITGIGRLCCAVKFEH